VSTVVLNVVRASLNPVGNLISASADQVSANTPSSTIILLAGGLVVLLVSYGLLKVLVSAIAETVNAASAAVSACVSLLGRTVGFGLLGLVVLVAGAAVFFSGSGTPPNQPSGPPAPPSATSVP